MNKPFLNLVALQFKEFFREPEIIFWAFVLPIVLSWLLGIAIGSGGGAVSGKAAVIESPEATADYWTSWIARARDAVPRGARDRLSDSHEGRGDPRAQEGRDLALHRTDPGERRAALLLRSAERRGADDVSHARAGARRRPALGEARRARSSRSGSRGRATSISSCRGSSRWIS